MVNRIGEALAFLLRRYSHHGLPNPDDRSSVEILQARGFSLDEIGQAFALLFTDDPGGDDGAESNALRQPPRVLDDIERHKLDIEAQGLIHMLSTSGALTPPDLDRLITTAMSKEKQEITIREIMQLVRETVNEASRMIILSESDDARSPVDNRAMYH